MVDGAVVFSPYDEGLGYLYLLWNSGHVCRATLMNGACWNLSVSVAVPVDWGLLSIPTWTRRRQLTITLVAVSAWHPKVDSVCALCSQSHGTIASPKVTVGRGYLAHFLVLKQRCETWSLLIQTANSTVVWVLWEMGSRLLIWFCSF